MNDKSQQHEHQPSDDALANASTARVIDTTVMPEITLAEVADILSLTIKHDFENKLITFLCMLSAYTDSSQLNVSFNAPSSSGKTYLTTEIAKLFPIEDKIELSGASPTSFFHGEGVFSKEREAKIVLLERKIILMYEQPNPLLQQKLRAVLSHDQRELQYRITNKDKKGTNRAELIIIRGFPATVFCSAGLQLDEQEATRAILLSPEVSEAKLKQGVHLQAIRGANVVQYDQWLESQPERANLMNRIVAIKNERVDDIIIENPEELEQRFNDIFGKLKPRHMRDMGHLLRLIKVVALLNTWHRRQPDGTIIANQSDIEQAFELWSKVTESQDLNVPPAVLNFYNQYIIPAYLEKREDPDSASETQLGLIGLSSSELGAYYLRIESTMLNDEQLRKQILPQLVNSGLITLEQPTGADRRSKHIFPKHFPNKKKINSAGNNVGKGGGVIDIDDEAYRLFFGT